MKQEKTLDKLSNFRNKKSNEQEDIDYSQFIGKTFNELKILNITKSRENSKIISRCECLCSCGKKVNLRFSSVIHGHVKSCGHLRRERILAKYKNYIGRKFGELTILNVIELRENSELVRRFECLCSCGKKSTPRVGSVIHGYTSSCGHLVSGPKKDYREFVGKTFGELTILDVKKEENKNAKGGYIWRCECICSCGKKTRPRLSGLLNGGTKSCGHLRTSRRKSSSQYVGKIYGELTILNITESEENSKLVRRCECLCSCGRIVNLRLDAVLRRSVISCGHFSKCPKENYTRFIGEKFGELTILEFIETRKKAVIIRQFKCLCSCGKEIIKRADFILYGKTKSCGHLKGENLKKDYSNLIGEKFGELTILDISEPMTKLGSQRIATCICLCGREIKTLLTYIINGRTKTCGYCSKSVRRKDYSYLIGQSIGKLTILSHVDDPNAAKEKDNHLCKCSCGREVVLPISEIVDGVITSCLECERKEKEIEENTSAQQHGESLELGMRNIHWDEREQRFVVAIKRSGKWFKARAKTLEQAIEKRDQKLREAEEFAKVSKFIEKLK